MIVRDYTCPRCRSRWPGFCRILGHISIWASIALVSGKIGAEIALYHASPGDLVEAARLRMGSYGEWKSSREPLDQ